MPQELQIIRASEFIRMGAHGHFDLAASKAALAELARACRKRGIDQAMMDLRALHPGPKPVFSPADLAALVNTFKEVGFTHQQRLAILYGTDPHHRARLFAFLSSMHGWHVRAFGDFEQALLWLSGNEEAKAKRKRAAGEKEIPVQFLKAPATAKQHGTRLGVMAALLPAALLVLVSCASKHETWDRTVRTEQQETGGAGFGGQTYSSSVTTTSTVVSVDAAQRTLQLKQADGTITTYKAGPEVADFGKIKAGDRVRTTVAEERTVSFAPAGTALSDQDTNKVVHPPDGGPAMAVTTRTVTAKILSLSYWDHTVTIEMADGKPMTVKANPYVNLATVKPGDKVSVRVSTARTFVVER